MKQCISTLSIFVMSLEALFGNTGDVADPIRSYITFHNLSAGRIIYRWNVDLNNDGTTEMLLATKLTPAEFDEEERANNGNPETANERDFTVFIQNRSGHGYFESKGVDEDGGLSPVAVGVDITRCFLGMVTQLNKWGLVTVDIQPAGRRNSAEAMVYAYTFEGDHLKLTVLAQYDPNKGGNPIYDQYLKEGKRTKVKLEEITVK